MDPAADGDAYGRQLSANDPTRRPLLFRKRRGLSCIQRQTLGYLVCFGIVATMLVAVVLVIVLHHETGLETLSLCVSEECSIFAEQVSSGMNRSVPPCQDFYEFVCGNWANANPGHVSEVSRASADLIARAAGRLTARHARDANASIVDKAAELFSVCLDGPDQLDEFRSSVLPGMGVRWPEPSERVDPVQLMVNLSVKWQQPTLIQLRTDEFVQLNPERSPVFDAVGMNWWYPLVLKMRDMGVYEDYVRSFYQLFSDRPDNRASDRVAEKLESSEMFLIERSSTHSDGILDKFQLSQAQIHLTPGVSLDRWIKALNNVWSFLVTPETYVYVIDTVTIRTVDTLLSNITWADANLLIGWHVIQKLAPAVSPKLRDLLVPVFGNETGQLWSMVAGRCMDLATSLLGMVPFAPIIQEELRLHTREMAEAVYARVSHSFQRSLRDTTWLDEKTINRSLPRVTKIKVLVGPPREADTEHVLSNLYKDVPAMTADFLSSWNQTLAAMQPRLVLPEGYADVYVYNPLWHEVRYNDDTSTLIIPVQDLFMPFFHIAAPGAINFAGLGALVARGLAQVFDPFQEVDWTQGWSEESKRNYSRAYSCLQNAYGRSWQPGNYRRLFGDLAPIGSIYRAFRPSPIKDRQLADLREFSPQETFFIAFCHAYCVSNPLDETARTRCNVPLRNLPDFADIFKCASGTPMNPPEKCMLW